MNDCWNDIREEFPLLHQTVRGKKLVYLDNAATTQIPGCVMESMTTFMQETNANVHRGMYSLSDNATRRIEEAREKAKRFLGGDDSYEIIFTSGMTHGANMAAAGCAPLLSQGDEITVSMLEHHSNLLPWRYAAQRQGCSIRMIPCPEGDLDLVALAKHPGRIIAVTAASNLTGSLLPIDRVGACARENGSILFLDGAQSVRHSASDVETSGCDFYAVSGHKMCGCTGTGLLLGKKDLLRQFEPLQYGGGTVSEVTETGAVFDDIPYRLEAGTQNLVGIVGLAAAMDYLEDIGRDNIAEREQQLTDRLLEIVRGIDGVSVTGNPQRRSGIVSFSAEGIEAYDIARMLDMYGIAVRSGTHCAEPAVRSFGLTGTVRASVAFYNTFDEIEYFGEALKKVLDLLGKYR